MCCDFFYKFFFLWNISNSEWNLTRRLYTAHDEMVLKVSYLQTHLLPYCTPRPAGCEEINVRTVHRGRQWRAKSGMKDEVQYDAFDQSHEDEK
jgi:hypothetical protein